MWDHFKETFKWSTVLIILSISLSVTLFAIFLHNKMISDSEKLKVGDKIRFSGQDGTIKSIDGNNAKIEMDVPKHILTKDEN